MCILLAPQPSSASTTHLKNDFGDYFLSSPKDIHKQHGLRRAEEAVRYPMEP